MIVGLCESDGLGLPVQHPEGVTVLPDLGPDSIEKFWLEFLLEKSLEFWLEYPDTKKMFKNG